MPFPSLRRSAHRALLRIVRGVRGVERRRVALLPEGEPLGSVLLSYVIDPFLLPGEQAIGYAHTQDWESWAIARTWLDLGFAVDAIHWTHREFVPRQPYDVVIDPRWNLERLAEQLPSALKIFHAETAHWLVSDAAQERRRAELERRRGIRLRHARHVGRNRGIESADCAVVLGNEWTLATYRPFGKPLYSVPLSNAFAYPSPAGRDFEASRGHFLWFGGVGFLHKGLDLVLDAFAGTPGLTLDVAAPLDREREFVTAYRRELYETDNVRPLGWLDVASPRFLAIAERNLGMVFPSCSEGGGGSVITAMHAGLVPVVTPEASVDVEPGLGVLLPDARVETLRAAALELASRPAEELGALAVAAWRRANERHTRARFRADYRRAALGILERFRPELAERARH
jgi:hypothetical protein